jgi:hypothetical protein
MLGIEVGAWGMHGADCHPIVTNVTIQVHCIVSTDLHRLGTAVSVV